MNKTNNKRSNRSKNGTTKVKKGLPKNIVKNPAGSYRFRKTIKGESIDISFETLKEARMYKNTYTMFK